MKTKRFSRSSVIRILPALFVGLFPFTLLDDSLLATQYSLRGPRPPSDRIKVVYADDYPVNFSVIQIAKQLNFQHCFSFSVTDIPPNSGCTYLSLNDIYTVEAVENLYALFSRQIYSDPLERSLSKGYRVLYSGPTDAFNPIEPRFVLLNPQRTLARGTILVFIPRSLKNRLPLTTAFGVMNQIDVALNVLSNVIDGRTLITITRWGQFSLGFVYIVLTAWILYSYPILLTFILVLMIAAAHFVLSMLVFDRFGIQVPVAAPLISLLTVYLLGMSDRLDKRERGEWSLQNEAAQLRQLDEMRNNFFSLVSHDLKTPIAKIQALLERFLEGDFGAIHSAQKASLEKILSATGHLQRTISTLLLLGRIESRELHLKKNPTDLNEVLEEIYKEQLIHADERHVALELQTDPLFLLDLDRALIKEVIFNLVDNALKYAPPLSKIYIRSGELDLDPELLPPQGAIWFEVQDYGPGITPEDREKVLEKFVQGRNVGREVSGSNQAIKGTGLGLYLASFFVKKHGGRLMVYSKVKGEKPAKGDQINQYFKELETGTVIRVTLPIENTVEST